MQLTGNMNTSGPGSIGHLGSERTTLHALLSLGKMVQITFLKAVSVLSCVEIRLDRFNKKTTTKTSTFFSLLFLYK